MNGNINILIAGGGTGGHLFPAIAIGEEIQHREPEANIHFVGSTFGLEAKVFPIKDVWHTLLPIRGLQRGFNFISIGRNILLQCDSKGDSAGDLSTNEKARMLGFRPVRYFCVGIS